MRAERLARRKPRPQAVIVGGSLGAVQELQGLLPKLPANYGLPVILVLHQHRHASAHLGRVLAEHCPLPVLPIEDGAPILGGRVYLCPANYHLLIEQQLCFALSTEPAVNFARPSIDVSFESAARVYGAALVGVLLSGTTADGAAGLRSIKASGGLAFCQDPKSALKPTLPQAGCQGTAVDRIGSPEALGLELSEFSP